MVDAIDHLLDSTSEISAQLRGGVVAIGNFDGVHLGHQKVLNTTLEFAKAKDVPALVLTFEPHPRTWFNAEKPVFRLTPESVKSELLLELGFDGVINQKFNKDLASTSAEDFIKIHLLEDLGVVHVVTGFNFYFGAKRRGSPELLTKEGNRLGFDVTIVGAVEESDNTTISSSAIRTALREGDIKQANSLLGRRWRVDGEVVKGAQLGRTLGFPTANLRLPAENDLRHGIYAVKTTIENKSFDAVASYGRRPTFDNGAPVLEAYIFDFDENIYGKDISIEFVDWIRAERKFNGENALMAQMEKDCLDAIEILRAVE